MSFLSFLKKFDRLIIIGRKNDSNHIRLYPNPGFTLTILGKQIKWSKFYGLKTKSIKT